MTKMDTDSESQDSDDGRRFRFETTRKDISASTINRSASPRRESKRKSHSRDRYDKREHRHDRGDSKSRSLKCEVGKGRHEEERERIRDVKRHKSHDKDRERRRKHRSRDRSHDRNYNDQSHIDKQTSRCRNRSKRHSWSRSRDRSLQRSRSPSARRKTREEHRKHKSSRKETRNEDKSSESSKEQHERKSSSQASAQACKDIDLSDYNVLSETDENSSDASDRKANSSTSNPRKQKKSRQSVDREGSKRRETIDPPDRTDRDQRSDECHKVNSRNHTTLPESSNYNPGTVSDRLSGSTSTLSECKDRENETRGLRDRDHGDLEDAEKRECKSESQSMIESDEFIYGPILPPRYSKKTRDSSRETDDPTPLLKSEDVEMEEAENVRSFIGPCLPETNTLKNSKDSENRRNENETSAMDDSCEESDTFGPALPPHLRKSREKETQNRVIGPTIPDGVILSDTRIENAQSISDSEAEDIGPLPADHPALQSSFVHEQLEKRAERIKNEFREETDKTPNNREEWMTELPPAHSVSLGLTARKFRVAPGPDMSDRSCWSDTPAQKAEKRRKQETKEAFNVKESNKLDVKNCDKEIDDSREREKSLLELHQEKLRKKKKAKDKEAKLTGESTRRPFDRDIDLQINRVTESQKKSILRKAQCLDDRFTRGGM